MMAKAAAGFIHGAARSSAAPWKATTAIRFSAPHLHDLRPLLAPSSSEKARVRSTSASFACNYTHPHLKSCAYPFGCGTSPHNRRGYAAARALPSSPTATGDKCTINLRRLMKVALLCVVLQRAGHFRSTDEMWKTIQTLLLLCFALTVGFLATKEYKTMLFLVRVSDNSMKMYKVLSELHGVLIILVSCFFK